MPQNPLSRRADIAAADAATRRPPGRPRQPAAPPPSYLRTAEVADILHVSPKTVSRWAKEGKLPFQWTMGGHRRYPETPIRALVEVVPAHPAFRPGQGISVRDQDESDV